MPGSLDSPRARFKDALRRRRIEVVLPRRDHSPTLRHARIRRFRLPDHVEDTCGEAGPNTFVVDVHRVLNRAGFGWSDDDWHPFVATLEERLGDPDVSPEESVLADFYDRFQPETVHDILLGHDVPRRVLATWPAVDGLLDVWSASSRQVRKIQERISSRSSLPLSQHRGPRPLDIVGHHLQKLQATYDSIRETGYRPDDFERGVPTGYFLVDGQDYRVVLGHGNHQVTALKLLGVPQVPIKLRYQHPPVVARRDLRRWSIEGGGLFPVAEASALFDSYFSASGATHAAKLGLR